MKVAFIGCWSHMRIYAIQTNHVRNTMEEMTGQSIKTVTSNCGCFYENARTAIKSFTNYRDGLTDQNVVFIKLPHFRMKTGAGLGTLARGAYRAVSEPYRSGRFAKLTEGFDLVHFFQSADAFGYDTLKPFLRRVKGRKTVVTIYRASPIQTERPEVNSFYNEADAVIVSTDYMKRFLVSAGVREEKLHVIPYGASTVELKKTERKGAIMFAGSPLVDVKGFVHLARAMRMLKDQGLSIPLSMHGYYMPGHKEWAIAVAEKEGVTDLVNWVSFKSEDQLIEGYQNSMMCVIPYTGYPGCFPVTVAMANGTPVVASDAVGIPEYVDGSGLIVKSGSAEELAAAMRKLHDDAGLQRRLSSESRAIAEKKYAWNVVTRKTLDVYAVVAGR